ncbi:MAG: sugar phosphate nucleotidyltransferase [Burkholderiales bacterium]|nr:sugar phosphate nucleotidyltransferase [Burkholderiales bacterium]
MIDDVPTPRHDYRKRSGSSNHLTQRSFAFVLAGGRGTRLRQLTDWRAKPALAFAGKLKIIDFALSNCVNSGIRRIAVLTQYKAQSLIRHIERGWGFLAANLGEYVDVVPAQQRVGEGWYSGTADAVNFGVMAVDDDGRVVAFDENPVRPRPLPGAPDRALASMGIYVFDTVFLCAQLERDAADPHSSHDFGKDVIPHLVGRHRVMAHRCADRCVNRVGERPYWRDVGTVDAYWEAHMDLTQVVPELNLYDDQWPIRSLQSQLPPAKFVFDDDWRRGTALDSLVSGGCIVSGATARRSILFAKVRVGDGSLIEDCVVLPDVVIGKNVVLRRAVVDKRCILPDGFKAGVHPAEDQARFHVTERGIVLITPAMLGQTIPARPPVELAHCAAPTGLRDDTNHGTHGTPA